MNKQREKIIQNYIDGYNEFNVEKMTCNFDDHIIFNNVLQDEVNLTLNGKNAFKQQAEQAKSYFEAREQKISAFKHRLNEVEIEIEYLAILAIDFPNGLKKGQQLALKGKSIFKFQDLKITHLTDIS